MLLLDASAVTSLFLNDTHSPIIRDRLRQGRPEVGISTFASAEFAAAVSRRLREGRLTEEQAQRTLDVSDSWVAARACTVEVDAGDHSLAAQFVRQFALALRAPDALHIAIARRLGAALLTFDARQAEAARRLDVTCDPVGA